MHARGTHKHTFSLSLSSEHTHTHSLSLFLSPSFFIFLSTTPLLSHQVGGASGCAGIWRMTGTSQLQDKTNQAHVASLTKDTSLVAVQGLGFRSRASQKNTLPVYLNLDGSEGEGVAAKHEVARSGLDNLALVLDVRRQHGPSNFLARHHASTFAVGVARTDRKAATIIGVRDCKAVVAGELCPVATERGAMLEFGARKLLVQVRAPRTVVVPVPGHIRIPVPTSTCANTTRIAHCACGPAARATAILERRGRAWWTPTIRRATRCCLQR